MYLLGYDVGSSSIKATLLEVENGKAVASVTCPEKEMSILAPEPGWAEQNPQIWWDNIIAATSKIKSAINFDPSDVKAIGISYQMHGLVIVDKDKNVLRPAIIWCDSRAVETGNTAFKELGAEKCLSRLLNSPGNFTASKLKWVMENEPKVYGQVHKAMLPGDYIAMKMSGQINTTESGLSEGILWNFEDGCLSEFLLDYYGISKDLVADIVPTFSRQCQLSKESAELLGLKAATEICYRAGDQPNNALSLNVLNPGEIATTAGTSGVVYGIGDKAVYDKKSRVNTFVHVNHKNDQPRYGTLLCVNGTGILNSWLQDNIAGDLSYEQMNDLAEQVPIGSDGLVILPYGNGAERTLVNSDIGAVVSGLKFNTHDRRHLLRAGQEGIVFALKYGLDIMRDMDIEVKTVRAGFANMFLSPLFAKAFATITGATVELYNTDGSAGAARGAGIGSGIYKNPKDAFVGLNCKQQIEPDANSKTAYQNAYENWKDVLEKNI